MNVLQSNQFEEECPPMGCDYDPDDNEDPEEVPAGPPSGPPSGEMNKKNLSFSDINIFIDKQYYVQYQPV